MMKTNSIVIIDDDDDDRFLLAEAFRIVGVKQNIVEVSCGSDFMALIDHWQTSPDVILMDVEMPAMNGLELIAALQKHAQLAETPKIMLSANPAYQEKARRAGAIEFYVKPVTVDEYLALAHKICQEYLA